MKYQNHYSLISFGDVFQIISIDYVVYSTQSPLSLHPPLSLYLFILAPTSTFHDKLFPFVNYSM